MSSIEILQSLIPQLDFTLSLLHELSFAEYLFPLFWAEKFLEVVIFFCFQSPRTTPQ